MFDGHDLRALCATVTQKAIDEARSLEDDTLASASEPDLVDEIMAKFDMSVPVLHLDRRELTEGGSGRSVLLHVPFAGTAKLFSCQPNFYMGSGWPGGHVEGSEVVVDLGAIDVGFEVRADQWASKVQQYLDAVTHDLAIWRRELRGQLSVTITRRKQEAQAHQATLRQIAIPIRRREDAPGTYTEPAIVRRETPAPRSGSGRTASEPEPALSQEYYDHILFVIRAAGKAMERSPETYEGWGEEDRRQVLILMLNTHYSGKVYAEAFNGDGKTDILIREADRNVFIGECKFYDGPQTVSDTLDQIFGYATWRDVKLAMIFFVDRDSFAGAVRRIRETVEQNEQFRAWVPINEEPETEFRAQMVWPGDEERLVTMHVSSFHTPRSESARDPKTSSAAVVEP